jgi:hypothetical protein
MRKTALMIGMVLVVAGCQTPYKPNGIMGGYEEVQLSADTYQITGRGNGYTSESHLQQILLLRAADLTLQNGYRRFVVIDDRGVSTRTSFGGFIPGAATTTANVYGAGSFGHGTATTIYSPATPILINRPRGGIVIKMVREDDPLGANSFDAQLIYNQLKPKLS